MMLGMLYKMLMWLTGYECLKLNSPWSVETSRCIMPHSSFTLALLHLTTRPTAMFCPHTLLQLFLTSTKNKYVQSSDRWIMRQHPLLQTIIGRTSYPPPLPWLNYPKLISSVWILVKFHRLNRLIQPTHGSSRRMVLSMFFCHSLSIVYRYRVRETCTSIELSGNLALAVLIYF